MSFHLRFFCLTLASFTLAERLDGRGQPFYRRYRDGSYPLTNHSSAILSPTPSAPLESIDLTTTAADFTNVYMQPPRITSSFDTVLWTTAGSSDSDVELTASTTSTSEATNVYIQRPRTTSSLSSKHGSMASGSLPTAYFSRSTKGWNSSASYTANGSTRAVSTSGTNATIGSSNFTTTFTPSICSGTTTIFASYNAPRTRTVTEIYFVTIFGVFTDFSPPPVSTPLPFCDTVQIPYPNTTSITQTCSGTGLCITFMHTTLTTIAAETVLPVTATEVPESPAPTPATSGFPFASARPEVVTTWKRTQTVLIGDTPPPSFDPSTAVSAEPIQTGSDAATPTQERNVQTKSTAPPPASVDLGGIIASIFKNPFPSPRPSSSAPAGDSGSGTTPGSGGSNGQGSSPAPPGPDSPQGFSQHDNPLVAVTTASILVSLAASQIFIGGRTFPANAQPTTVAIEGQTFSINPSQVIASGITLNIPLPAALGAAPSLNSPASVSVDIQSNNVVIGGHTFTAGSSPTSTVINGQTFAINAAQSQSPGAAITAPPSTAPTTAPKIVTIANVPLAIQSGNVVIGRQTFSPVSSPTTVVIDSQTFTINPSQVIGSGTTIDIAPAAPTNPLSTVTAGGLTFLVGPSAAIISGTTYAIGGAASPMTTIIGDQTVSFGPGGVGFASTTVPVAALSQVTAGGLTFSVGVTEAVVSGTTYAIGNGASPTTIVIGGQTVSFGPNGVGFASTTVSVPTMSGVTAGGLTFSVGPTAAVISGTTYAIGNGASATTAVIGSQTVSFGPNGVGFASTTIPVPTASSTVGSTPGLQLFVGSASHPSIPGAAIGTLLACGVGILFLL